MRVITKAVWEWDSDGRLRLLEEEGYEYAGPVAWAKKEDKEQADLARRRKEEAELRKKIADEQAQNAREAKLIQAANREKRGALLQMKTPQPGKLSPWQQAQHEARLANIRKTITGVKASGLRSLNKTLGRNTPGAAASLISRGNEMGATGEWASFNQGLQDAGQDLNDVIGMYGDDERFYDPTGRLSAAGSEYGGYGQDLAGAQQQREQYRKSGQSVMGNIMGLASIFGGPIIGGISKGIGALGKMFRRNKVPTGPTQFSNSEMTNT